VLASATSLGDLYGQIEAMGIDRAEVIVTYVDRADVLRLY
jgi:hypothetical protein